jgi:hypothetical protein
MKWKFAFVLIAAVVTHGVALANAGPTPLPKDRKIVEPPVRFEGLDKHPDHVFYMYYGAVYFEFKFVELKDAEPIKLSFNTKNRSPDVYLQVMALERTEFEKRKKADPTLKWFLESKDGVLIARPPAPKATAPLDVKDVPVTTYRVTLKDGKLNAEKIAPMKTGAVEPSGVMPTWIFGIIMSISIAWFGLWFARRGSATPASK